jgi:hypothetical protein
MSYKTFAELCADRDGEKYAEKPRTFRRGQAVRYGTLQGKVRRLTGRMLTIDLDGGAGRIQARISDCVAVGEDGTA